MMTLPRPFSQLVSLLVAGLSFFAVWFIALTLTMFGASLGLVGRRTVSMHAPGDAAGWVLLGLACVIGFYPSVPVARFIARAFPVKANGHRRSGVIFACVIFGALYVLMINSGRFLQETFMMIVPVTVCSNTTSTG